jgi:6-phosphogluconolactonase
MIKTFANADALAEAVAGRWLDEIAAAGPAGAPLTAALSGGRITNKFFAEVVAQSRARGVTLERVHFFWADERCVPPSDPESNFRQANELLFGPLKISAGQIHRIAGEEEPEAAARAAAAELMRIAPSNAEGQPLLDWLFLGMGEDGHVASLFPGAGPEVRDWETSFLVIRHSPKPPPTRISLSYRAIAAARQAWVLVSGAGKEQALRDSLAPGGLTPLGRVMGLRTETLLFSDLKPV